MPINRLSRQTMHGCPSLPSFIGLAIADGIVGARNGFRQMAIVHLVRL